VLTYATKQTFFDILQMFNIYIKRAAELFGVTHTRSIYEKAIEVLNEENSRFVQMFLILIMRSSALSEVLL